MKNKEKQNLLEALFVNATESIIVVNSIGEIILMNPASLQAFQYEPNELYGEKIERLIPKRYSLTHQEHRANFSENPHKRSMGIGLDLFAQRKDGTEFPVEISLTPFKFEEERHVIAFVIDITRRKEIENQMLTQQHTLATITEELRTTNEKLEGKVKERTQILEEALNQLEQSKKELSEALTKEKELNELKSRFLSMASHEFRTPLTAILSSASLIEEYNKTEQQEKRSRHIERIKSGVNNLNDILSDFLSISKIEEGKVIAEFRSFNIKQLAADVVSEMNALLRHGQKINYKHSGNELAILDPKLIRNILINLISNAIKFSPDGKSITVETANNNSITKIKVKDEGIGISSEDKKHLFERFFRAQNATNIQGTGLGLNIVANYAQLLNGNITFESELDKGSTFIIEFENTQN
ncbi:MAG TPA: PAS domain-containing sensor histidine kinase [Bacteroidia bacterium]|nr:PAS domain-containing sensor histidine kinase [Bacteroidia bacterium]HNU33499.1 PAS domain-containing sensor histidine kinase [Bacteroidia bacterium]